MNPSYVAPNILTSGAAWSDVKAGGLANIVEKVIAAQAGTPNPTVAPTATATGGGSSGGNLAAGTYFLKFTEVNGLGETTTAPESAQLTVAAGNIPQVTFPALQTGNVARNLYATAAGGGSGTEVLYAADITTTTYNMSAAAPTGTSAPPAANTTAITQDEDNRIRTFKQPALMYEQYTQAAQAILSYVQGDPSPQTNILALLTAASASFHALAQAIDDVGVLIAANPGVIGPVKNAAGDYPTRRTV